MGNNNSNGTNVSGAGAGMGAGAVSTVCGVCNTEAGGRPLLAPGCCGQWYHQDCFTKLVSSGQVNCVLCSKPFPPHMVTAFHQANAMPMPAPATATATATATAVPAVYQVPPQAVMVDPTMQLQQQQQQQQQQPAFGLFGFTNVHPPPPPTTDRDSLHREDPVDAWVAPQPVNPSLAKADPGEHHHTVTITAVPEVPELSLDLKAGFYANVSMTSTSDVSSQDLPRPPMDIVCVLDTSGSMGSDNKLVNVKHAVNFMRDDLGDHDRMAVITFETSAREIHHLRRMTGPTKATTAHLIDQLRPGGGTRIFSGLEAAHRILSARTTVNPVTSVFLLTDGIDSSDFTQKKALAKKLKEMGCSLFVYGFGNDHDSAHLKAIADAGEGLFTFIERSDMVIDAFGGALGAEKSIFATKVVLTVDVRPGVKITNAHSGSYRKHIEFDGSRLNVYYNNLMIGEQRDVLVTVEVSACGEEVAASELFTTRMQYQPVGGGSEVTIAGGSCVVSRLTQARVNPALQRHDDVDVQVNRMMLAEATEAALKAADENDYSKATEHLQSTLQAVKCSKSAQAGNVKSVGFAKELEQNVSNLCDATTYKSKGGRSMVTEMYQSHNVQRCTYAKEGASADMWQNTTSAGFQSNAKSKKKAMFLSK